MSIKISRQLLVTAFLFAFTCLSLHSNAQENGDAKMIKDTLILRSGAKFVIGDKIQLGYGSNASKGFEFVFVSPYAFAGAGTKLGSAWTKLTMVIKKLNLPVQKNKARNFILLLVVAIFLITGVILCQPWSKKR